MWACYVYYRVAPAQAAQLLPKVLAMQARLAQELTLETSLQQRVDAANEQAVLTWMEIYRASGKLHAETVLQQLQQAVSEADILAYLQGERHLECFMDIQPCA